MAHKLPLYSSATKTAHNKMLNLYKNAEQLIGLTKEDSESVLSHILSEYRRLDGREEQGVDWVDIISEILDEKNITHKYTLKQ